MTLNNHARTPLHKLPTVILDQIETMSATGETPEAVAAALLRDHGIKRRPATVQFSSPFQEGRRRLAEAQAVREAADAAEHSARTAAWKARHWRHPEHPGVTLPRLTILAGAPA
ncbi:hypothetical protein [Aureimonas phyllosphaerae]|uniref:Uncharacterized protein n=1 Tax=Aureimonas phyllosphaerae TaxID=1166078 RepID=A0A7W6BTF7_9HYPH|nr:hypothetical protein [Aureimonas phyllosphaerae]MBB3937701.1 hypothetical protein [Aureimonas phyllosphaerae]MBB3961764.1 hypothetical protein [Aureimonas phyllosphaerae]SFF45214.1 hypothetical protein SAMN05216566_11439 [Aureimonas phyllosphaerae]